MKRFSAPELPSAKSISVRGKLAWRVLVSFWPTVLWCVKHVHALIIISEKSPSVALAYGTYIFTWMCCRDISSTGCRHGEIHDLVIWSSFLQDVDMTRWFSEHLGGTFRLPDINTCIPTRHRRDTSYLYGKTRQSSTWSAWSRYIWSE